MIKALCIKLEPYKDDWSMIIGVGRGGIIPAIYVSHYLNKPMGVIMASRYAEGETEGGRIKLSTPALFPITAYPHERTRVLVIDEMVDEGVTLHAVKDYFKNVFDKVDFAVVLYKPRSTFMPNYYVKMIDNNDWIVFPTDRNIQLWKREEKGVQK